MPIGDGYSVIGKNILSRIFFKLFGISDLHTHIRLKPLIRFFDNYIASLQENKLRILELGCGTGVNAFEIDKIALAHGKNINYIGIDKDEYAIRTAVSLLKQERHGNKFMFYRDDAVSFLEKDKSLYFDVVLLIDVIEHIKDTKNFLRNIGRRLKTGGIFVISVPTPLYPKVFGERFHKRIGHLIDGYILQDLDDLFIKGENCRRILHKYNTGLFSNIGCFLYYKVLGFDNKYFNFLKTAVLYPFIFMDFFNSSKISSTLFIVYKKIQ